VEYSLAVVTERLPPLDTPTAQVELELGLPPKLPAKRARRSGRSEAMLSVAEFHFSFNLPIETRPQARITEALMQLRIDLLREEVEEFVDAAMRIDTVGVADALGDIVYVAYGTALSYGIDLDAVIREVHRANMSKLDAEGHPILRDDGKVLKSASYVAPDIRRVLLDQPPLFLEGEFE